MATERERPGPPGARPRVTSTSTMEGSNLFQEKTTWVQCDSPTCLKWRLVHSSHVKLDVKEPWFCHMNPDPAYGSCSVAEEDDIPQESMLAKHGLTLVYSPLPVGSLVLAKLSGWPKWPAIVSPDPHSGEYITLRSDGGVKTYHVEFLGKPHTRCWSPFRLVEPYHHIDFEKVQFTDGISKKSYPLAFEEATRLLHMECEDRLQMCHFMPDELLSDAQPLMTELEDLKKQFKQVPSSCQTCSCGVESDDDSDLEEVGDFMDIESFRFVSSPTMQGLMALVSQSRSGSNNDADVTIIEGVGFESFEREDLMR